MIVIFVRLNKQTIFALMSFVMKLIWFMLFIYQIKDLTDLSLIADRSKSDYVHIKNFNKFMHNKT